MSKMRKHYPDTDTAEGRALRHLRVCHRLYREERGRWIDDRMLLRWRAEARLMAVIVSGRDYPHMWREVEATIRLIDERERAAA